jgi:hypothetical protein
VTRRAGDAVVLFNPLVLSAVVLVWFNLVYRLSASARDEGLVARALGVVAGPIGAFVCLACLVIPFVFLNVLGVGFALIVCFATHASARTFFRRVARR